MTLLAALRSAYITAMVASNLVPTAQKAAGEHTTRTRNDTSHRAALRVNNMNGVSGTGSRPREARVLNATRNIQVGSNPTTIPNLPSKGGSTPRGSGVMNAKSLVAAQRVEPAFPLGETGSRADWNDSENIDSASSSRVRTANFPSSMDKTTALVVRGNGSSKREKSGLTPGGNLICGNSAKGSVTRSERFGASPKAMRPRGYMADFHRALLGGAGVLHG